MTAPTQSTTSASKPSSRRALLAGALGGLGAWVATAVGRASPVHAEGETMVVGGDYLTATTTTTLVNPTNSSAVLQLQSHGNGSALVAESQNGAAVFAIGDNGDAMFGITDEGAGVRGQSVNGFGVQGTSSFGWAGWFDGKVHVERFVELTEIGTPTRPGSNRARLYIREREGKTQLCVRFHNGTIRVLAGA